MNMLTTAELKQFQESRKLPKGLLGWINTKVLIEFFGISDKTLKNWRRLRKITYTKFNGIIMYDVYEVMRRMKMAVVKSVG